MIKFHRQKPFKRLLNQRGQGAIEYILLLVIAVAVITGLIYQFNKSFEDYAANYFGNYLKCLLRAGELPTLGSNDPQAATASACADKFEEFTFTAGRPPSNNNSSGNNNQSSRPPVGNSKATGASSDKNRFRSNAGGSRGGSRARGSGSRRGGSSSARRSGGNKFSAGKSFQGEENEKDEVVNASSSSASIKSSSGDGTSGQKDSKKDIVGKYSSYAPDKEEVGNPKKSKVRGLENEENEGKKKAFRANASIKKKNLTEEDSLSFGDYFRFLIIAAILIILFLVVGGQILQITKGPNE